MARVSFAKISNRLVILFRNWQLRYRNFPDEIENKKIFFLIIHVTSRVIRMSFKL